MKIECAYTEMRPISELVPHPHYCDVIIKRWEDFTGRKAELVEEVADV